MSLTAARELHAAILAHPEGEYVNPRVEQRGEDYVVITRKGTLDHVPERLALRANACSCTAPWCTRGKISPARLDLVRREIWSAYFLR
jgi:hypothetical protein